MSATPSTEDFKRIVESLKIPLALVDAKGILLYRNPPFSEATGEDQAPLDTFAEAFVEADRKRIATSVERVAERKTASVVIDVQLADGRFIQLTLTAPSREKGPVVALLQDTTSQRDTENALNISSARLLANSPPQRLLRRRGSKGAVGTVGLPSRTQPCSSATSAQSEQTSTYSPPSGEKRVACSPISRERSQIEQIRVTAERVTRIRRR